MQIKKVAYFTLCRPVLGYGSAAWDPYEKEQITQLEVLQNKALRFIFNVKGRDVSMSELRESQGIDSLEKKNEKMHVLCCFIALVKMRLFTHH